MKNDEKVTHQCMWVTIQGTNSFTGMTPLDLLLDRIVHWMDPQNLPLNRPLEFVKKNFLHWTDSKIFH